MSHLHNILPIHLSVSIFPKRFQLKNIFSYTWFFVVVVTQSYDEQLCVVWSLTLLSHEDPLVNVNLANNCSLMRNASWPRGAVQDAACTSLGGRRGWSLHPLEGASGMSIGWLCGQALGLPRFSLPCISDASFIPKEHQSWEHDISFLSHGM